MEEKECGVAALQKMVRQECFSAFSGGSWPLVSASAYDTAWITMVPHPKDSTRSISPLSLHWIIQNQKEPGFWGSDSLALDCIPSTLACMAALKTWGVGFDGLRRGLNFIHGRLEEMLASELRGCSSYPRWFSVMLPGMVEHCWSKGLELFPHGLPPMVQSVFASRQKIMEKKEDLVHAYHPPLIYFLEALPLNYEVDPVEVTIHQSHDGSLFQSPSATAGAFLRTKDERCLSYLESLVQKCSFGVPPVYPLEEMLVKLCMVERLENLGLDGLFQEEVDKVMLDVYRNSMDTDLPENNIYTCPLKIHEIFLAYRLLTMHGYQSSLNPSEMLLKEVNKISTLKKDLGNHLSGLVNVYRACQVLSFREDTERYYKDSMKKLLEKGISTKNAMAMPKNLHKEIEHELGLPWLARMDHLDNKKCIERREACGIWSGKAWFRIRCLNNDLLLTLAKQNYTHRQSIFKKELEELKGWVRDQGISSIGFGREKTTYCYFSMSAAATHPHLRLIRMMTAKSGILLTIIDDFFDIKGTMDELTSFTHAIERWDSDKIKGEGKILFNALDAHINEMAKEAFFIQGRDITNHLRDIWCQAIRLWLKEAEWCKGDYTPSMEEYLGVAVPSVGVQTLVLPSLYLVGPSISEEMIYHPDYKRIMELLLICSRFLNDLESYQKEREEGKCNLIALYLQKHPGSKIEDAYAYIVEILETTKKYLLQEILINNKNIVPIACRKIHLIILKIFQMLYNSTNAFDSPTALIDNINKAIYEPIQTRL